jgi:undecaprenyl-diphosphatase
MCKHKEMDDFLSALILAVVQGIAEWFPISSSGHLVLVSHLLGYENTLAFDLALHFGTLMAVFVYFGKDITNIVRDLLYVRFSTDSGRMGLYLLAASLPAAIIGFIFHDFVSSSINDLGLLTLGFFITAVLLMIGSFDVSPRRKKLSYILAFFIGLAQCASFFRGISRSGTTVTSGLLLGLDEKTALRFSFLLSIPIISGANLLELGNVPLPPEFFWASLVSFIVGLVTINLLMKVVLTTKKNLRWFALYVFIIALALGAYVLYR